MPKPIADGSHYIQKSNQDYWLRLNGVWVRMGNIRDEGTGGLVDVPPIWGHGLVMDVAHLDRWRYIPDEAGFTENFGFDTTITALDRIRYIGQIPNSVGFAVAPISLLRVKQLTASFNMGFITQAQLHREIAIQAAFNMGFTLAVETDAQVVHQLNVPMAFGLSTAATVTGSVALSAAFAMGFNQGVALEKNLGPITESLGFSMNVTALQRIRNITASMAMGFNTSAAVSGFFGTHYIPTNTVTGPSIGTPSAVNTDFTYNATGGAAESHLYDGDDSTPAATATGLQPTTHAAYDFGVDTYVSGCRIYSANANGFANNATFKVQYSDSGLTSGWHDAGTITVLAGTGTAFTSGVFQPSMHRYWQIIYSSGTTLGNSWIGELSFTKEAPWSMGFGMAVVVTGSVVVTPVSQLALGFSMAATVRLVKAIASSQAYGFSMSAPALTITHMLTVPMALGFNEALTLTHIGNGTPQIPTAVETSFTYTGQTPAASQAALYDSNDTTDAADPTGLQTTTHASYDLGAAKNIINVRIVNSPRFTSSTAIGYKIQFSDSSVNGPWTDTGVTVSMPATLGAVVTASISSGSHRYWKLVYSSGTVSQNAWLGELQFRA